MSNHTSMLVRKLDAIQTKLDKIEKALDKLVEHEREGGWN